MWQAESKLVGLEYLNADHNFLSQLPESLTQVLRVEVLMVYR